MPELPDLTLRFAPEDHIAKVTDALTAEQLAAYLEETVPRDPTQGTRKAPT